MAQRYVPTLITAPNVSRSAALAAQVTARLPTMMWHVPPSSTPSFARKERRTFRSSDRRANHGSQGYNHLLRTTFTHTEFFAFSRRPYFLVNCSHAPISLVRAGRIDVSANVSRATKFF